MIIKCKAILGSRDTIGLALWPFIFIREDYAKNAIVINHEKIHLRQQLEMFIIPFYILYVIEWISKGYMNISFEREAYKNECDMDYIKRRKLYSFRKYFKK